MRVKRTVWTLVVVVALAACGGDDSGSSSTTTDPRLIGPPESVAPTEPPTTEPTVTEAPVDGPSLDVLTQEYGCGFGFQIGNADQTVGLFVTSGGGFGEPPAEDAADLSSPSTAWSAEILLGADLFANWCDDVIEFGEPEPRIDETWPITAGTARIADADAASMTATLELTDLVATAPDGAQYELGDITIENPAWGMFAG